MWLIAPLSALISMLVGGYFYLYVKKQDSGTEKMQEISSAIREGARVSMKREYTTLAIFVTIVAILLLIFLPPIWQTAEPLRNAELPMAYVFGSFCMHALLD